MAKLLILIILFFTTINITLAYSPTENENKLLVKINEHTIAKTKIKGLQRLKRNISSLEMSYKKSSNERIKYLLNVIIENYKTILNETKIQNQELINQKNIENENQYKLKEIEFLNQNGKDITTGLDISEKCTKYFDFIDNIARENNFPTELIIATWSIEYNCNLSNPNNEWGPFQITSRYYKPGEITLEQFTQSITDFINFSKGKWDYFNNNTYNDYKSRFGEENIDISYNNYSLRDLKLHSILYNGINSYTGLDTNVFTNANLNSDVTSNSDGLVTRLLKVLNWRIDR